MKKIFSLKWLSGNTLIVAVIALFKFILSMAFSGSYGYFRDELYYIACSDHLDWGYVDQPPLSLFILKVSRWLLGDSLPAIRFTSALAGAAVVFLAAMIARKLGGGRLAQVVSACAAFLSPIMLVMGGTFFSMNAFDFLFWALSFYVLVTIIKENRPKLWPLFGLIAGLGLMNKYSILFLGIGLVAGLLLTSQRKQLINKWFWAAAAIVLLITLPHIIWEIQHDFPSLEFMQNARLHKNASMNIGEFFFGQILFSGFGQAVIWIAGLCYFFFHKDGRKLLIFGLMYPIVFVVMLAGNAKVYYLSPIYTLYFAAGAVLLEKLFKNRKWLGTTIAALILAPSLVMLPYAVPMLPVETYLSYAEKVGISIDSGENNTLGELPQHYADMFGWEEFADKIAGIYNTLTPEEKEKCIIFVQNYGEAGAVDFFGKKYGLPKAYCGHNSYWYWADQEKDFDIMIIVGPHRDLNENLEEINQHRKFDSVELAGTTECRYCMPYENGRQLFLCRGAKFTLKQIWAGERFCI
jgi:hypothetical protein